MPDSHHAGCNPPKIPDPNPSQIRSRRGFDIEKRGFLFQEELASDFPDSDITENGLNFP